MYHLMKFSKPVKSLCPFDYVPSQKKFKAQEMKLKALFALSILGLMFFYSCKSEEEVNPSFQVSYKNQDLKGKLKDLLENMVC